MSEKSNSCVFIGLPNSGKSSFIGAFWHVVESGEIDATYSVTVQPDDREYLNSLRASFLNCEPVERTKSDFSKKIELSIKENPTGAVIDFVFPDLSGETYQSQFEHRKLSTEYVEQIEECNNIMLFVNPDYLKKGYLISTVDEMLDFGEDIMASESEKADKEAAEVFIADTAEQQKGKQPAIAHEGLNENRESSEAELSTVEEIKWTARMCQTQVVLVDLLQMIKDRIKSPCKINIVISAWDVIKNLPEPEGNTTPDEWVVEHLPLLYQYLNSTIKYFEFKIFGISAQGGKYSENSDENFDLQAKLKQSERIIVQSGDAVSHDITVPLKWFFE